MSHSSRGEKGSMMMIVNYSKDVITIKFQMPVTNRSLWFDAPFASSSAKILYLSFLGYCASYKLTNSFWRGVQLNQWSITLNPFLWQSTESSPRWPPSSHRSGYEAYLSFLISAQNPNPGNMIDTPQALQLFSQVNIWKKSAHPIYTRNKVFLNDLLFFTLQTPQFNLWHLVCLLWWFRRYPKQ